MGKLTRFLLGCLTAALLLQANATFAAELTVGTVIGVRGDVFNEAGGNRQHLVLREPVHLEDTLVADAGKAKILLNDGSIISLGEHSRLALRQYQGIANGRRTILHLFNGVLRMFVNRATAGGAFEVETETAVAAVRGTDWLMEAVPEKTSVAIISGIVAVTGRAGGAAALLQRPGDGVDVPSGKPPEAVHRWGQQRFQSLLARASFE
jgi:hypothetical protein